MFEVRTATGSIVGADGGQGPALVFLHGGPGLSDYADLLAPELAGWRVLRYQQRGLPPSTVDGPFTVEQNVADAVAVLDARGVHQAVVVGHSWGVHLAAQMIMLRAKAARTKSGKLDILTGSACKFGPKPSSLVVVASADMVISWSDGRVAVWR